MFLRGSTSDGQSQQDDSQSTRDEQVPFNSARPSVKDCTQESHCFY